MAFDLQPVLKGELIELRPLAPESLLSPEEMISSATAKI
jgi:hypothetical protein